jgi:GalNAc-alpha-(1->4)-GalNAc-alpha-(1->3)-diNAcBac-PP-undecaprenol alpha-1,4-N-acetyl-D-galactosaminyltransferase
MISRKRILFFIGNLDKGGAERIASILLTQFVESGFDVNLCLTSSPQIEYYLHPDIKVFDVSKNKVLNKLFSLRKLICKVDPDYLISFLPHINVQVIISSLGLRPSLIICERIHPFFYRKNIAIRLTRFLFYGLADKVVYQTNSSKMDLIYIGKNSSKEFVIPNPCDKAFLEVTANYSSNKIISVGRLANQKRHKFLIDHFYALHRTFPEWTLHIVGKGPLECELKKRIQELGLQERVFIEDTRYDLPTYIQTFSIFCLTSEYEGFPNALLEAMAAGLATISYDCLSGPREMTGDGESGIIIDTNDHLNYIDSLQLLMTNEDIRMALGRLAKTRVQNEYLLDHVYRNWLNILS